MVNICLMFWSQSRFLFGQFSKSSVITYVLKIDRKEAEEEEKNPDQ